MSSIVLFDGECNFCDSSVQFIIKRDSKGYFHFASLQSDVGRKLIKEYNVSEDVDSIMLVENGKAYFKSAAALRISRHLAGGWKLFYALMVVPSPIRNLLYDFIARNRYKWFGKKEDHCMLPSPDVRKRFL
ncbi:thiol-disulfide oxidoreductase DCC family protein [Domibacillus epiphyticus]|uniref:Thiol-disulfide oxidoreductase n=1 Tax=Domibacillus epiphyticus TaxID=1714355 RepID=A0A1V2ABP1_9BACI|nr:thiol-disulfide oxidoreductase DCC family protein [Domibacillus epiphyticus]OMP68413.1 thiol-disulfide oxidoreductase [Domibacillus epiphyticus]